MRCTALHHYQLSENYNDNILTTLVFQDVKKSFDHIIWPSSSLFDLRSSIHLHQCFVRSAINLQWGINVQSIGQQQPPNVRYYIDSFLPQIYSIHQTRGLIINAQHLYLVATDVRHIRGSISGHLFKLEPESDVAIK